MCVLSARTLLTMHVGLGEVGWGGAGTGREVTSLHLPPPLSAHNTLGLAQKSMVNLLYLSGLDCWALLLLLTCIGLLSFACFAES